MKTREHNQQETDFSLVRYLNSTEGLKATNEMNNFINHMEGNVKKQRTC